MISAPACSLAYLILLDLGVFLELMAMFSALVVLTVASIVPVLLLAGAKVAKSFILA